MTPIWYKIGEGGQKFLSDCRSAARVRGEDSLLEQVVAAEERQLSENTLTAYWRTELN